MQQGGGPGASWGNTAAKSTGQRGAKEGTARARQPHCLRCAWTACSGHLFPSICANTGHFFLSIPANSRQRREAACCRLTRVLERRLSSSLSPPCCGDAQQCHSAAEPLFMSSTAQKACVNTTEGESQVVTSNDLTVTWLYPSPKHSRLWDAAATPP